MQECQDLIVEIGTEELPPMSLNKMSLVFQEQMQEQLNHYGLSFAQIQKFSTPRRIAVLVEKLTIRQMDQFKIKKGPALHLSFDPQGVPTAALNGFLNSLNIKLHQATQVLSKDQKTGWFEYHQKTAGTLTANLIPTIIERAIHDLPSPKMSWGSGGSVFARPVHWLLVLFGQQTIEVNLFGITSGNITYGHRFLSPQAMVINHPNEYASQLAAQGYVIADFNHRKQLILSGIQAQEQKFNAVCPTDEALLEQVTNMVEDPVVLCADFAEQFLKLPHQCLRSVMGHHQKSFALFTNKIDPRGAEHQELLAKFIFVSNMKLDHQNNIIRGNEQVMHARLQDAMFLYEQDLRTPITTMLEKLKTVVLEEKLGNVYQQSIRIQKTASAICLLLHGSIAEQMITEQAAMLCKADLASKMVLEFPELQGVMGGHYVEQQGMGSAVGKVIVEHYWPKFAEDQLPDGVASLSVALAYRLNLLCEMFAIGTIPSGDKDPFALRRHAVAIVRMLIEKKLSLKLNILLDLALSGYLGANNIFVEDDLPKKILNFCMERLKNWYINSEMISTNLLNAVLARSTSDLYDLDLRIKAIKAFSTSTEFPSLVAANKRVGKLLEKTDIEFLKSQPINSKLFFTAAESSLFEAFTRSQQIIAPLLTQQKYNLVLQNLTPLTPLIDQFFDQVRVMVPEQNIQQNRLSLLVHLRELLLQVADLAQI